MNQLITSQAFCKSLSLALANTTSFKAATIRIRGMLANMTKNNLHIGVLNNKYCQFYVYIDGKQIYLSKSDPFLYELARKRYLKQLLKVLELYDAQYMCLEDKEKLIDQSKKFDGTRSTEKSNARGDMSRWAMKKIIAEQQKHLQKLLDLIVLLEKGNLDLARIVMTPRQYKWYTSPYKKKLLTEEMLMADGKPILRTVNGILMRSKSEQKIGNKCEAFAAPYHYEEQLRLNVLQLVRKLEQSLFSWLNGRNLFYPKGNTCYWNVPDELKWMNATGSIWRAFDYRSGKITIYNDFRFLFADDTFGFWEHEGSMDDFKYRSNANERCSVMRLSGDVAEDNLIETSEAQANDDAALEEILATRILPRMWF